MGTAGTRIRTVLTSAAVLLLALLALPAVAGALPPEYAFGWAGGPYVWQPLSEPTDSLRQFSLLAPGPAGSVYAATGEQNGGDWALVRLLTSNGSLETSVPPTKGPHGYSVTLSGLTSDAGRNAIVAGTEYGPKNGDVFVAKVNPAGKVLWQRTWDGSAHSEDHARAVAVDAAGNIYVAGATLGTGKYLDALVLKYSPRGVLKWKYIYKTAQADQFLSLGVDSKGGVYVTGSVNDSYTGGDIATLKLDALGHKVWLQKLTGFGVQFNAYRLKVKGTGVYVTGFLFSPDTHPVVLKYSLAGKRLWAYGHSMDDAVISPGGMAVDNAGRVVFTLNAKGVIEDDPDLIAAKVLVLTPGGKLFRTGVVDGTWDPDVPREALALDTTVDSTGRIYVAGRIDTAPFSASSNASVTSFPPAATEPWAADRIWRYDSPASGTSDRFTGLLALRAGEVYAAGQRTTPGAVPERAQPIVHRLGTVPAF